MSFKRNRTRKNVYLSACFCLDCRLSLPELDQKFKLGGAIGYADSYWEFLIPPFKKTRQHAILQHDAGTLKACSGKIPVYYYIIGRKPKSCLLNYVT